MDLSMPQVDGYLATRTIRQFLLDKDLTQPLVCAVTGHCEEIYAKKAYECGMNMFMPKPIEAELLTKVLKETGCFTIN